MADGTPIKDASGNSVTVATDELSNSQFSPLVSLLKGDSTATIISPATSNNQATAIAALEAIQSALEGTVAVDTDVSALALESGGNLAALVTRLGEVQTNPTANTVLDRLKDLLTGIVLAAGSNNIGDVDVASIAAGDNNIGNVDVASLPALPAGSNNIGDVDVASLPALAAGTNLIGRVSASLETGTLYSGTTALTPKFVKIAASSSGNNTLVAAVTSKKLRVLAFNFTGNGAVNVKFQDGASGTDMTGLYYIAAAGGGISVPFNPLGWFETTANTLLNLNLSGAVAVGGSLVYVEV
jgi:hypothetical protein